MYPVILLAMIFFSQTPADKSAVPAAQPAQPATPVHQRQTPPSPRQPATPQFPPSVGGGGGCHQFQRPFIDGAFEFVSKFISNLEIKSGIAEDCSKENRIESLQKCKFYIGS